MIQISKLKLKGNKNQAIYDQKVITVLKINKNKNKYKDNKNKEKHKKQT
jgi:hypothetical protein